MTKDEVYRKYNDLVKRNICKYLIPELRESISDDLVSQSFERIYKVWDTLDTNHILGYLMKVSYNEVIRYLRSNDHNIKYIDIDDLEIPDEQYIDTELLNQLDELKEGLSEFERELIDIQGQRNRWKEVLFMNNCFPIKYTTYSKAKRQLMKKIEEELRDSIDWL